MTIPIRSHSWLRLLMVGAGLLALGIPLAASSGAASRAQALPEFKHQSPDAWINSAPLTAGSLRGKVVLLEVYTSG